MREIQCEIKDDNIYYCPHCESYFILNDLISPDKCPDCKRNIVIVEIENIPCNLHED